MFCNIPNANVAAIADGTAGNADSRTMAYDGLDRLTTTNAPHQWWIRASTTFDALDNIRANQVGNTPAYLNTFSYDPATWRLSAIAGHVNWALAYDPNGNVTSKGTGNDAYVFDAANRLQSVAGKESYRYDGYGRRVKITRSSDGKADYPIYTLAGQLLTEDDQRSGQSTDYVSLNGSLVAKRASPIGANQWTTSYEHTDALRSPVAETSAAGALTRAELYTPFGEPGDNRYLQGPGYTGHVTDAATHLTYAQQRYYDPVMGRFLSPDPMQADDHGGDFNRYWYANDNPYKFTDRDGRIGCATVGTNICGAQAVGTETSAISANDKVLLDKDGKGPADTGNSKVATVNRGLARAGHLLSHTTAVGAWNQTKYRWDPDNKDLQYVDPKTGGKTAAVHYSYDPFKVVVGDRFASFGAPSTPAGDGWQYHKAIFPGSDLGMTFAVLHEFAHVWNQLRNMEKHWFPDAREDEANNLARHFLPFDEREAVQCENCR